MRLACWFRRLAGTIFLNSAKAGRFRQHARRVRYPEDRPTHYSRTTLPILAQIPVAHPILPRTPLLLRYADGLGWAENKDWRSRDGLLPAPAGRCRLPSLIPLR